MDKKQVFKVVKQLQIISVKPWQDTMKCSIKTSDGDWFSAFGSNVGKAIEGIAQGDVVEIEYTVNEKGFSNFTNIKLVEDGKAEETPPDEEGVEKPRPAQKRGIERMDKNSICAIQGTCELMKLLDLTKMSNIQVVERFKEIWDIILEEIER